ncbi:hypothetical protein DAEQUDRAFT_807930 [Daedalea quercina L-15889]|uniref:Uncharacterized protein n=1 Tax=Daedalea quercina L-15889 TaxID=1314783 RepID=A0A165TNQ9_9APHY|nr:hypothetical protein DAEQUDRAFT_807930 [Daedalea quercina L-15889]
MSVRQRIPFRFSENEPEDDHVLDEQEQEELIESLRSQSDTATMQYMLLGQVVLALSALLHLIYILKGDKISPLYAILPSHPPPFAIIPFANFFAMLNIALHANLSLLLLPFYNPIRQSLSSLPPPLEACSLPLPILHPLIAGLTVLTPTLALLRQCSWPDVAWWCATLAMSWFVYSLRSWTDQSAEEIRELERLRYDARGA